jgi:hypothetical protein
VSNTTLVSIFIVVLVIEKFDSIQLSP